MVGPISGKIIMADWSHIPKELLLLILGKLNDEIYFTRFRSVCSTWRFSIPKHPNHFPLNLPPLSDCCAIKLDKHSIFLIKPPTTPSQQTLPPWLVRISPTSTGKFHLWHPLLFQSRIPFDPCVLNFNQLSVFPVGQMYICRMLHPHSSSTKYRYDWSVATFQGEQILDIVTRKFPEILVMLRRGDDSWTYIPHEAHFYHNICIFKGRPCVVDMTGRTVMIESDLSVHLVAKRVGYLHGDVYIVVENESELLLVHKIEGDDGDGVNLVRFDVFWLDQKEKKWLKLANLGDRVMFLGPHHSFTASAMDLGLDKGNFVIYCNKSVYTHEEKITVFHLDQQRNSYLSNYPDYLKLFWPPPEWILNRCLR